jgi:hypothetical protein
VDESSAQEIQTVGDAAALIDKLIAEKDAWKDNISRMNCFASSYIALCMVAGLVVMLLS